MAPPTKHKCEWYPISWSRDTGDSKPVLWACGVQWRCIKTATRVMRGRGKNRKLTDPEPTIPVPTRGMWANIKDEPPEV